MTLEPFQTESKACRKCGYSFQGNQVRYCEGECVANGRNGFIDAGALSGGPQPHLHRTCTICHFEWLTECKGGQI